MTSYLDESKKVLTVTELTEKICDLFEHSFNYVLVEGEVSNLRIPSSGHHYFVLKDEKSQIRAVLFNGQRRMIPFDIKDGQKMICLGRPSVYAARGEYQIIVENLEPSGLGSLHLAFEQLKKKLEGEGLFDEERKRAIPTYPRRIGVVSSPTGAAVRDIINVLQRRNDSVELLIAPAAVQGEGAASEIANAIELLNSIEDIDTLIVGRGGGSIEDLWSFNEESVARAIYNSKIPVVSAVGHETDFTISDFVADLRAPTPSAAAELVARSSFELEREISSLRGRALSAFMSNLSELKVRIENSERAVKDPRKKLGELRLRIDELLNRMEYRVNEKISLFKSDLRGVAGRLDTLSPLSVLARGYSIATSLPEGTVIRDKNQVDTGDIIEVSLHRGKLLCKVEDKRGN